ncbi:MAG TPA: nuclear transport factor 2 family protein [Xanthomonadales bacterium]|nr:nuclear transport factor 2 family protein [Xanthomonadales bacterium]
MNKMITATISLLFSASLSAADSHQALQDAFVEAMVANDAAGIQATYAPDAVSFDMTHQRLDGPEAIGAAWAVFLAGTKILSAKLVDPHVEVHGDTGIAWGEFTMTAEPVGGGEAFEMTGRYSDVTRNFDGQWLYVLDHVSAPMAAEEEMMEEDQE